MYKGYEPEVGTLNEGDVFIVEGFRYTKKGKRGYNCRKGRESQFIIVKDDSGSLVTKLYK